MTNIHAALITLLSNSIRNEKTQSISLLFDEWLLLYREAVAHQIDTIIFSNVRLLLGERAEFKEFLNTWKTRCVFASVNQIQICEIAPRIFSEFHAKKIPLLMFKGFALKDLYPSPESRLMGDIDLFIKEGDLEAAARIIESFGYHQVKSNLNECHLFFSHPTAIPIELHYQLIPLSVTPNIEVLQEDIWASAQPYSVNGAIIMVPSTELTIVYLLLHMAKHFTGAGFGLRHLADIALYIEKNASNINVDLINKYLNLFNLEKISSCLLTICYDYFSLAKRILPYFDNATISKNMLEFILNAGIFGNRSLTDYIENNYMRYMFGKYKNYRHYLIKTVYFPSRKNLGVKYEYAKKIPILLPFAWIHRMINRLFSYGVHSLETYKTPIDYNNIKERAKTMAFFNLKKR